MSPVRPVGAGAAARPVGSRVPGRSVGSPFLSLLLAAGLFFPAAAVSAQRPGLLRQIKSRLSFRPATSTWEEARRTGSAEAAARVMEQLAQRHDDPLTAARAGLWLGHLHYGQGDTEGALAFFQDARSVAPAGVEQDEAAFWVAQCRNLLGTSGEGEEGVAPAGLRGALTHMVRLDGALRVGRFDEASRGYLDLEGEARTAGCLGALYYRVGLLAATGVERGLSAAMAWEILHRWEKTVPAGPEHALVAAMAPPAAANDAPASPAVPAADSTGAAADTVDHGR